MGRPPKNAPVVNDGLDSGDAAGDEQEEKDLEKKSPRERFLAAANRRFKVFVARTRALGKLHTDTYTYTPAEAEKLIANMQKEVDSVATLLRERPDRGVSTVEDLFASETPEPETAAPGEQE